MITTKSKTSELTSNKYYSSLLFVLTITASLLLVPLLAAAVVLYRADPFDPAPFLAHHHLSPALIAPPIINGRMLQASDFLGSGRVFGPEDIAYEPGSRVMYTGCADGWVKRVHLGESLVEDWVNTGGRPLGLATVAKGHLIVADAHKGLLKITKDKQMKVLANEADGIRFKLTDGVDVANDGTIYFTDASYKYAFEEYLYDILENRPYGRLLSFNPNTGQTKVVLRDLYFPNGVALSPDQDSLIFCETPLKRCRRYWIQGSKKGCVDAFIDDLPGFPDNIHFDGHNNYLIAISSSLPHYMDRLRRHRLVRKSMAILERYVSLQFIQKNGGIFSVDLQGNPTAHLYDPAMSHITSAIKVDDHLYIGSLHYPHIIRFNLSKS